MEIEERILRVVIKALGLWFLVLSVFIWESPKPWSWKEVEEETQVVEDEFLVNDITVTVYNPVVEQTDSTPLITADNSKIDLKKLKERKLRWVAVSRDLLDEGVVKYGDRIRINCKEDPDLSGVYTVHDTMNPRWRKRIDILAHQEVRTYGKYDRVEIEYLGRLD